MVTLRASTQPYLNLKEPPFPSFWAGGSPRINSIQPTFSLSPHKHRLEQTNNETKSGTCNERCHAGYPEPLPLRACLRPPLVAMDRHTRRGEVNTAVAKYQTDR